MISCHTKTFLSYPLSLRQHRVIHFILLFPLPGSSISTMFPSLSFFLHINEIFKSLNIKYFINDPMIVPYCLYLVDQALFLQTC